MARPGAVYVVASSAVRRRAIVGALRVGADRPEVHALSRLPTYHGLDHHAVIVVDLHDGADLELPPPTLRTLGGAGWVLIATSTQLIPAAWLAAAREPHVELLLGSHDQIDEARLRGTVVAVLAHARERVVAGVVRRCGALLAGREEAVRAVVADPWGIRRPRDWAQALNVSLAELKATYLPPRVARLEHLLTLVRWCAYEFLTLDAHLSAARAFEAVGVRDRADFRRQLRRARAGWRGEETSGGQ